MNAAATDSAYSFEHGIDHVGYNGAAPIFYVGGPVVPQDFAERDLSGIRGVSISQGGLPKGTKWKDLNLGFLFEALPKIEYLRILFEDVVSLGVVGPLPALRQLVVDCPKARGAFNGDLPLLQSAEVRWPDEYTAGLVAPQLEKLWLTRPLFQSLAPLAHLSALRELGIFYARHFNSFQGLESFPSLEHLEVRSCPSLVDLNGIAPQPGPRHLVIHSCKEFADASAAQNLSSLQQLGVYAGERGPDKVLLPQSLNGHVEIDLRGVEAEWV